MSTPKPWFMSGHDDDNKDDNNENNEVIDKLIQRIDAKIQELEAEEKAAQEDSLFGENTSMSDSSDCEDELFEHTDEDCEMERIDYSKDKCDIFPEAANILGSIVKQSVAIRDYQKASEFIKRLDAIPVEKHGFNTIVVEIMYLLFDPYNNEKQIRKKITFIKKKFPMKEEGLYYEGILEGRLGNIDNSMTLLRKAVEKCRVAPRSAELLAYELLKSGEFEETIKYANMAITMSAFLDPIIDTAKVCYCKCLAQDALLCNRVFANEKVPVDEINSARLSYESLKNDFPSLKYSRTIDNRISVLNQLKLSCRE